MLREGGHPVVASLLDVAMYGFRRTRARLIPQAAGTVLELGIGTGANLEFYGDITSLTAVEPDPHMRRRAEAKASTLGREVTLLATGAEALPFSDDHFDTVVATWVLCTIPNPEAAVREASRVLKPDGRLLFAEHTLNPHGGVVAGTQRALTPCWRHLAGGCRLDRDSLALLRAHFGAVNLAPHRPQRWSVAPSFHGTALEPLSST